MESTPSFSLIETQTQCAYVLVAATVLIAYDYAVTILKEYRTVWKWRRTSITIVFLIARWVLLCEAAGYLAQVLRTSLQSCVVAFWISAISQLVGWALLDYLIASRIWALCDRNLAVPIICGVLGFVPVASNAVAVSGYRRTYEPHVPGCVKTWVRSTEHFERNYTIGAYVTCFSLLCRDSAVVGLTWYKIYKKWREAKRDGMSLTRTALLYECFLRDGSIYFLAILIINVSQLAIFDGSVTAGEILNPLLTSVPLMLAVRFTMNIRESQAEQLPPAWRSAFSDPPASPLVPSLTGERATYESVTSVQATPTSIKCAESSNIV